MKIERTKNATRNIFVGMILKMYQIIVPFVMRTIMIYYMGLQYTGLNSLFTSILQVLNLAELGVGSAMTFSMYKPIAEDDTNKICMLMKLYRKYYRIIGLIIAVVGTMLTPFVPKLIKNGNIPSEINIYIIYLMNLSATVLTYWLFAFKNCLLVAHQRNDVSSKITIIANTVQYILQITVIFIFKNYYLYLIIMLATQIMTNISTSLVVSKMYPNYKPYGELEKNEVSIINKRIRDLFTSKLGTVIINSADSIVISAFLGLEMLTIYQNYYFILTSIIGFLWVVFTSCTAGIGNSLIVETKEKNYRDLKKFTILISWIAGLCSCFFLALYQPFMIIWVGEELTLEYSAVVCFVIYYFIYEINQLLNLYKDAGGIWREDKFRPLVTALTNLAINLALVRYWGIYGVLLSTVISMIIIGMPWLIHNLFTTLFEKKFLFDYLKMLFACVFVTVIVCAINTVLCVNIHAIGWTALIIRGIITLILPNILFWIAYSHHPEFNDIINLIDKMTKNKLKLSKLCKNI